MTHPPQAELLQLQSAVAGRYSLERELGRGGMGIVFLARDVALERYVAIKLLPPHFAREAEPRERFLREARTAAQLLHPNIVPIHAVEAHDDLVFFVMAYVDGETLTERVRRAGVLNSVDAAKLMQEVAWALGYAHGRGIVHRDVKPDNILIEHGSGRAMVADFGIARVESRATLSAGGTIVGTVQYMSPEQASTEDLDGRSDVYSLGATLYFALTGNSPVEAPTVPAMLLRLVSEAPSSLATRRPELPPTLVGVVMRCLAKSREDRFDSADALAQSLLGIVTQAKTIRPEIRNFIRELHALKVLSLIGIVGAVGAGVAIGLGAVSMEQWPMVPVILGTTLYVFVAAGTGLLLNLMRAGIGRDEIISALADEIEDVSTSPRLTEISTRATIRLLQGIGTMSVAGSIFLGFTWTRTLLSLPAADRTLGTYAPFALLVFAFVYGCVTLATTRIDRPLPKWQQGGRTSGLNSWPLKLMSALLDTRLMRYFFNRRKTVAMSRPSALPTATLLLRRLEDLVGEMPAAVRSRVADVIPVASRIERAVAVIRERIQKLDAAIAELPAGSADRAEFQGARSHASQRLEECIGVMESLRADCLRLSLGLLATDGLTLELERAEALSVVIDAELRARGS